MTVMVDARVLHPGQMVPPPSKSDAHRALILAEMLGQPPPVIQDAPADVVVVRDGLAAIQAGRPSVDCRDGGAPFRFLVARAALETRPISFFGTPRLAERPHAPLLEALAAHGVVITRGNPWPITVLGAAFDGKPIFHVRGQESSQFPSALLMLAGALHLRQRRAWTVELDGSSASEGYLDLTVAWMRRAGFDVAHEARRMTVERCLPLPVPSVPSDWSSLGYLLLAAWKTGGRVAGVDLTAAHPDRAVVSQMRDVGLHVHVGDDGVARVDGAPVTGLKASARECPDLIPTLAAWACVLPAPSVFQDVEFLRHKESDRLDGLLELCAAAGATAVVNGNTLTVSPSKAVPDVLRVDARDDHRRTMAAVTLAVLTGVRVELTRGDAVGKSFPGFFTQLGALGVKVTGV